MLKTAVPPEKLILEKVGDGESGDGVDGGGVEIAKKSGKSKGQKMSKSWKLSKSEKKLSKSGNSPNFGATESRPSFLTPKARSAFNRLQLAFIKALILRYFDLKYHIWIKTDVLDYAIGDMLSQLASKTSPDGIVTKADLGHWHLVAFFFGKMILAETQYETHDRELLAIVKVFKTWRHYLKGCKHEVLVLTNYHNLRRFINTKSLSSRHVRWAQKLSHYHFQIDYCQGKANAAADALSKFFQRSQDKKDELQAENDRIFHHLQNFQTNASLARLNLSSSSSFSPYLYQVLICGTYVLPQLREFWTLFRSKLSGKSPYIVSIGGMRLRLQKLQNKDKHARKLRVRQLVKDKQDIDDVLHYQGLPYVPEIIQTELISRHHDDPLVGHFGIKKIRELIVWKYY